jgi:hypothetical protein
MAAGSISYYFTLFKKFQVLNHVPEQSGHGDPASPLGGFNLNNPNAVFGASDRGNLLAASTVPSDSPLWAILNSRASGNPGLTPVTVGGVSWPTMPTGSGTSPPAWNEFQLTAAPPLVTVFGNWITAGKTNDTPSGVIGDVPPVPIPGPLDPGVSLFVCSMPGDVGIRPDAVPSNFWATSLVFLVDPTTGNIATPTTLNAGDEWYLVGVVGNRGNTDAGRYLSTATNSGVESAGVVMVWNTVDSPGVELPSLSNLDASVTNPIYDSYIMRSATYDIVGFRLNVQTVFNGIIAALNQAFPGTNGRAGLGGLTPEEWVHAQPAHLCAKIIIRQQGGAFPNVGDSPINNARVAQKNLAPFDINLQDTDPTPNILWKNFVTGTPFFLRVPDAGLSRLNLVARLPEEGFRFLIGIPTQTFNQLFRHGPGILRGFREIPPRELCESPLGEKAKPFPDAVVFELAAREHAIEFPPLPEKQYLGMAVGIEYDVRRLRPGNVGELDLVHHAAMPKLVPGTRCFDIEETVVGGFTLILRAFDPVEAARARPANP